MILPNWNNQRSSSAKSMTEGKKEKVLVLTFTPPNITRIILESVSRFFVFCLSLHNLILPPSFFAPPFPVALSSFFYPPPPFPSSPAVWGASSSTFTSFRLNARFSAKAQDRQTLVALKATYFHRKRCRIMIFFSNLGVQICSSTTDRPHV